MPGPGARELLSSSIELYRSYRAGPFLPPGKTPAFPPGNPVCRIRTSVLSKFLPHHRVESFFPSMPNCQAIFLSPAEPHLLLLPPPSPPTTSPSPPPFRSQPHVSLFCFRCCRTRKLTPFLLPRQSCIVHLQPVACHSRYELDDRYDLTTDDSSRSFPLIHHPRQPAPTKAVGLLYIQPSPASPVVQRKFLRFRNL